MLVPEVVWASSVSMSVVEGFMVPMFMPFMSMGIFIGVAWLSCGVGFCVAGVFIPGMSGISGVEDGFVCEWMAGVANMASENTANISLRSI